VPRVRENTQQHKKEDEGDNNSPKNIEELHSRGPTIVQGDKKEWQSRSN
jgi:hypothetical protein